MGQKKDLKIDEFVEITMSSRKTRKQRRIEEVLEMLADSDTLIVTELSRLGRSTAEVIALVNELVARNIRVIILKQNLDISQHDMTSKIIIALFSLFAELGGLPEWCWYARISSRSTPYLAGIGESTNT